MYEKTIGYHQSVILVKTDFGKIVGAYIPDQVGPAEYRKISNGKTLQFYFGDDELIVCTLRDGLTETYTSNQYHQIYINGGLDINANRADFDYATIIKAYYSCPDRIGYARDGETSLWVSGSDSPYFKA